MTKIKKILFVSCVTLITLIGGEAIAWNPFGPKTYEDCFLDGMKGVKADQAANAVVAACAMKFSKGDSSSSAAGSRKVKCGGWEGERDEHSRMSFPSPNDFGQLRTH